MPGSDRRSWVGWRLAVATHALLAATAATALADEASAPPQDVAFVSAWDGSEQRYVLLTPVDVDARQPRTLLIALHGHGSDRWQFIRDARDECRAVRDVAARRGMIYVSPDYRAATSWMGPAATADLRQILAELKARYTIENVIVCGGSMGGTSALAFAAMHPEEVDGVVSLNGTANLVEYAGFADAIAESYGGSRSAQPEVYRRRSAELFPERLTMPVGLTTGGRDALVPPESAQRLAEALAKTGRPVKLIHRPEGGHATNYADATAALDFVADAVAGGDGAKQRLLEPSAGPATIVCLGDSVTGVYYHTGGQRAYPELLEIALRRESPSSNIAVVNAGISGQTTKDGLARLDRDVLSRKPDLVTVSFGLNDMTRIPPEEFRANLIALVDRSRAAGVKVVLCTPNAIVDNASRPTAKLIVYCDIIRAVGREQAVPVCDQYLAGESFRDREPWPWRLTMSDDIHPNCDGHRRMAEELCRTITGRSVSLDDVGPLSPALPRTRERLKEGQPVRVLAMPPYDALIGTALSAWKDSAVVEVTRWEIDGKSLAALRDEAQAIVRTLKPDLVLLAPPREAGAGSDEEFAAAFAWLMNWSLSFGRAEWDCLVVHPSVAAPASAAVGPRDGLTRQLVGAQGLELIDRDRNDATPAAELFSRWFRERVEE